MKEQEFIDQLWDNFLSTTIPIASDDHVKVEVFSEVLKVLLSPFMRKSEKVLLLMTVQQLFLDHGALMSEYELMKHIVEPFTTFYGVQMYNNAISDLVQPKRDIEKEAYASCTFKPQANTQYNDKLALKKYFKDVQSRTDEIEKS